MQRVVAFSCIAVNGILSNTTEGIPEAGVILAFQTAQRSQYAGRRENQIKMPAHVVGAARLRSGRDLHSESSHLLHNRVVDVNLELVEF